ncbi:MAG: hypothetical protein ACYSWU_18410 [Planctomycetota bacterium]|jgi:hypothetical protein
MAERKALERLRKTATKKGWLAAAEDLAWQGTTTIGAPIDKVSGVIARALKPDRKVVSAVKFQDGAIEEIRTASFDDVEVVETANGGPYRKKGAIVKAATSVAAPRQGCPEPDFASAEIKARRVLAEFLEPDQLRDFRRYNRFVSVGQTTGHRYMITSRHANDELSRWRTALYDVDAERSVCTHDWDVPAAEEMLGLHIFLQIEGGERFLRSFPGDILDDGEVYEMPEPHEFVGAGVRAAVNQILRETEQ